MEFAKVMSVQSVCFGAKAPDQQVTTIHATGEVPTGGWGFAQLVPYVYVTPPADGLQDFDFIAEPPTDFVIQVVSPITALWTGVLPPWAVGVRVHSSTGFIEAQLSDGGCIKPMAALEDGLVPWPWSVSRGDDLPWPL